MTWWLWLMGAYFTEGMLTVVTPARDGQERLISWTLCFLIWPYFLILFAGKACGAALIKLGLK